MPCAAFHDQTDSTVKGSPCPSGHETCCAPNRPSSHSVNSSQCKAFEDFAQQIERELSPRSALEQLLAQRVAHSAAVLNGMPAQSHLSPDFALEAHLCTLLGAFGQLRTLGVPAEPPAVVPATPSPQQAEMPERWSVRLEWIPEFCESSPVIKGTWISANQIISRIVDGWTWNQILRTHPEITENDIRACLAYAVEEGDPIRG